MNSIANIAAVALLAMGADAKSYYWKQHMYIAGCRFESESETAGTIKGGFKVHQLASENAAGENENPVIIKAGAKGVADYTLYEYQIVDNCELPVDIETIAVNQSAYNQKT